MKRRSRKAFSLLEVIAAVVILAVVAAATVATIAPMRQKSQDSLDDQSRANLEAMAQTYFVEFGRYPTNAWQLANQGYLSRATGAERRKVAELNQKFKFEADGRVTAK